MTEHFKIAAAWSLTIGMITWIAGIALFVFGPRVETKMFPVITSVRATVVQLDTRDEVMRLAAYGSTERQCESKALSAFVYRNGAWHQGSIYFTDPRKGHPPITTLPPPRPIGTQSLGEIFVFPSGEKVRVFAWHQCHPLWTTMTFMYELDLSASPAQVK